MTESGAEAKTSLRNRAPSRKYEVVATARDRSNVRS